MPTNAPDIAVPPPKTDAPAFLIAVDTEGDNQWARPRVISTRNAQFLDRFQQMCERYRLKPTYVTNWEMANCPVFQAFARDVLVRGRAEIGMHLHASNTPPLDPLTDDDLRHLPYLFEYPPAQMREKIVTMTNALEDTFGRKMVTHRAGRWGFNELYASVLRELGYLVDCSVTPHVSWVKHIGAPGGSGGPDYRGAPDEAYWVDPVDIKQPGDSELLEVPCTIIPRPRSAWVESVGERLQQVRLGRKVMRRYFAAEWRFRPERGNRRRLLRILSVARQQRRDHVLFSTHSSELMPGGSPTFPTPESIEKVYADMEALFAAATEAGFAGMTLEEYYRRFRTKQPPRAGEPLIGFREIVNGEGAASPARHRSIGQLT